NRSRHVGGGCRAHRAAGGAALRTGRALMPTPQMIFADLTRCHIRRARVMLRRPHADYLEQEIHVEKRASAELQVRLIQQTLDHSQYAELGFCTAPSFGRCAAVQDILERFQQVRERLSHDCQSLLESSLPTNHSYWKDI